MKGAYKWQAWSRVVCSLKWRFLLIKFVILNQLVILVSGVGSTFQLQFSEITEFYSSVTLWLRRYRVCLQRGRPGFNPWVGKIPWRIPWTERPSGLQSVGSPRTGHNGMTNPSRSHFLSPSEIPQWQSPPLGWNVVTVSVSEILSGRILTWWKDCLEAVAGHPAASPRAVPAAVGLPSDWCWAVAEELRAGRAVGLCGRATWGLGADCAHPQGAGGSRCCDWWRASNSRSDREGGHGKPRTYMRHLPYSQKRWAQLSFWAAVRDPEYFVT